MNETVGIVCQAIHVRTSDGIYISPSNWVSLFQWWSCFKSSVVISPIKVGSSVPKGWKKIPENVDVVSLRPIGGNFFLRKNKVRKTLRKIVRECGLLYLRMPFNDAFWAYEEAKKIGLDMICEFHGDWSESYLCQVPKTPLHKVLNQYRATLARSIYGEMGRGTVLNFVIGPALQEKYLDDSIPCSVTTNHTVRSEDFQERNTYALKSSTLRISFIGELQERKGLLVLLEALNSVRSDVDFELNLIGDGQQRAKLENYCDSHSMASVNFLGYLPMGNEIKTKLIDCDLFVLPSIAAEGVPRVIQEAMSVGCPVIATDIGSTRWQLRNGAGVVVESNDASALTSAIRKIYSDEGYRESIGRAGFKRALEHSYELQMSGIHDCLKKHLPKFCHT